MIRTGAFPARPRLGGPAVLLAALTLALLSACSSLPRGAALESEVTSGSRDATADFQLMLVTRETLPILATWPGSGATPPQNWIPRKRGPSSPLIAAGDRIDLAVWDSEENSLLTPPGQMMVNIEGLEVTPQGTIFVPYIDEVVLTGETPDSARRAIQEQFARIIPSAQVQLSVEPGQKNTVDLVGGVARPGNFPLPGRDYTVLNLISAGGGIPAGLRNPQLRLIRDDRRYTISAERLFADPTLDTTLRGGDKLLVEEDKRSFISLGATGTQKLVEFPKDRLNALEVVSLAGGVNASRGSPKGVLVLRDYPAAAVRPGGPGPAQSRVIFSLDLASADGLFSAGRFHIQDGDVVLATEAPVTALQTVLRLFGTVFGVANRID